MTDEARLASLEFNAIAIDDLAPRLEAMRNPSNRAGQPLTPKEREVIAFITRGYTNEQIAGELGISIQTVKNHVSAILVRLNASDRAEAAVKWVASGAEDLSGGVDALRAEIGAIIGAIDGLVDGVMAARRLLLEVEDELPDTEQHEGTSQHCREARLRREAA